MQYPITDQAAVEFTRGFYESLADGLPVDAAVAEARKAMSIAVTDSVEWGTPVLFMRASDGVLFDLAVQQFAVPPIKATDMAEPAPLKSARVEEQKTPQELPTKTKSTTLPTGIGSPAQAPAKLSRQGTKPGTTVKPLPQKPEHGAIASSPPPKIESAATTEPAPQKTEPAMNAQKRSDAEIRKTARPVPDVSQLTVPKQRLSRLNLDLSVQPVSVEEGGTIAWTITVSNAGDDDLREVDVKIGTFSLGTLGLPVGESRQMTGSAALEYSPKPTVLYFAATGLNSLGQEVHAEAQRAIDVLPRRKVQPPPAASPKSAAPSPEEIAMVLQRFKRNGLYVAPDIPIAKLQKALRECQAPKNETGLGLIEGAVFGWYSCLLFGSRGIYYCNPKNVLGGQPGPGSVSYADFPACELKADSWHMRISLSEDRFLDVRNMGMAGAVNPNLIAEVLNSIKKLGAAG